MSQAQPCIEYNPACVECRRDAGKDAAGTTWQCIGHAYLERDRLRTAQAERDAALQRAEQAEAALAQTRAKRDSLIKRLDFWIECNNGERANGRMPTFLNPYTILLWIGDKRVAAEADAAQPPALPPLPEGWCKSLVSAAFVPVRKQEGYDEIAVSYDELGVGLFTRPACYVNVADLITVLRHAEAAHLKLKGGAK